MADRTVVKLAAFNIAERFIRLRIRRKPSGSRSVERRVRLARRPPALLRRRRFLLPRTVNGSILLCAPAALVVKREERKNVLQQPAWQPVSPWFDRRRFRGTGVAVNCGVLRLWRSHSIMHAISSWVRAVSVGGENIPVSIASNMPHSGKVSSAAEASRTSMSRARLASSRAARRRGAVLAISSPTDAQRLTACQQKPISQGIGQRQAAPSSVVGEGRTTQPQTASTQRVELSG